MKYKPTRLQWRTLWAIAMGTLDYHDRDWHSRTVVLRRRGLIRFSLNPDGRFGLVELTEEGKKHL